MKCWVSISILIAFFASCKKDPPIEQPDFLKDEKAIFIGSWDWQYSDHWFGGCDNQNFFEQVTPANSGSSHQLVFSPNGLLRHIVNNEFNQDYELFFTDFYVTGACLLGASNNSYSMDLNNSNSKLYGCISEDTMLIGSGFLFDDYNEGCEAYNSYFTKSE